MSTYYTLYLLSLIDTKTEVQKPRFYVDVILMKGCPLNELQCVHGALEILAGGRFCYCLKETDKFSLSVFSLSTS